MNEQQQAELLARWLEDGTGPPPEGLDAEVVESIVALKPELAPPPTLSADDILAGVSTGPLATLDIPMGASVGAPPSEAPLEGASSRRRPWFMAIAGIGGISSLAAAALVAIGLGIGGLTLVNSESAPQQEVASAPAVVQRAPSASAIENDAVVAADTGLRKGSETRARKPSRRPVAKTRSRADATEEVPGDLALKRDGMQAPAEAVADVGDFEDSLDPKKAFEDEDAGARLIPEAEATSAAPIVESARGPSASEPTYRPQPARPAPAPAPAMKPAAPPPPPAISEPREYAEEADDGFGYGAGAALEEAVADEKVQLDAEPAQAQSESKGSRGGGVLRSSKAKKEARREKERQKNEDKALAKDAPASAPIPEAVEAAAVAEENLPIGGSDAIVSGIDLQQAASLNASSGATAESAAADRYIQAADYRAAIAVCDEALLQYTATTRARQNLLRIKGNAHARLGEQVQAQDAWQAAIAVRDALDAN